MNMLLSRILCFLGLHLWGYKRLTDTIYIHDPKLKYCGAVQRECLFCHKHEWMEKGAGE